MTDTLELSIRFTAESPTFLIGVVLVCTDSNRVVRSQSAVFDPPLEEHSLAELRWYLEVFPQWQAGLDYERAKKIEVRLVDWGQALLESVTKGPDALHLWHQFSESSAKEKVITIDAQDSRVLQLPWELLADKRGYLCLQGIGLRRSLSQTQKPAHMRIEAPVRVLYVAPRPDDVEFIDPRPATRALLDAVEQAAGQVEVEFLYPPTLKALAARLRDRSAPPVHVLHFDSPGLDNVKNRLGMLLFENEAHQSELVDARRLGKFLSYPGVPIVVLNSPESAAPGSTFIKSIPGELARARVGSIVAMNYDFLVTTTEQFTAEFYAALIHGCSVRQAVDSARRQLMERPKRYTLSVPDRQSGWSDEPVQLHDWFVPVLYQQAKDSPLLLDPPSLPRQAEIHHKPPLALTESSTPGGLPAPPPHGFRGRAREMLALERMLAEHQVVVLQGLGGIGKTTLAVEAARWLYRTVRFPGGVAYMSFMPGSSLEQLCSIVTQALSGEVLRIDPASDPAKRVEALIRKQPALVILDDFESVLGHESVMPAEEVQAVLDAVWSWSERDQTDIQPQKWIRGSRVLIVSRSARIPDIRFQESKMCAHFALEELAVTDALELAGAILDDYGIDRRSVKEQEVVKLIKRLEGHPLALTLVLPYLRDHSLVELSARLQELLPGLERGADQASLTASLEFVLRRLTKSVQAHLPDLAVFQGGCMEDALLWITEMKPDVWQEAQAALEAGGLISAQNLPKMSGSFLNFHPVLLPYISTRLTAERRATLEAQYCQWYYDLGRFLYKNDLQHSTGVQAIAQRELPNLLHALDLMLESGNIELAVDHGQIVGTFLDRFGRRQERATLLARIQHLAPTASIGEKLTRVTFRLRADHGQELLEQGRAFEAEKVFRDLIDELERGTNYDLAYDHAVTLLLLGRCLQAQGQPVQAIEWQNRALSELQLLDEADSSVQQLIAAVHTDLGQNLALTGQLDAAERAYQTALTIMETEGDQRGVAVALHQLGNLAVQRLDLPTAESWYYKANEVARGLGDMAQEAAISHQIGLVSQEQGNFAAAERAYRRSLQLKEKMGDTAGIGRTSMELARLYQATGRLHESELWYRRAIEINTQIGDQLASSHALNNLGALYLEQGRLDDAKRLCKQAVELKESLGLSAQPWMTYSLLAQIAEAQGDSREAEMWRRREQDSYAAYPGAAQDIRGWRGLIDQLVQIIRGGIAPSSDVVSYLDRLGQTADWKNLITAIRWILAGERDLERLRSGLDRTDFLIVHSILAGVEGTSTAYIEHPGTSIDRAWKQWEPAIKALIAVAQGDPDAQRAIAPFLDKLAQQDDWSRLAGVFRRILAGERDGQALRAGLDPTDTSIVVEILHRLGADASTIMLRDELGGGQDQLARQLQAIRQIIDEGRWSQAIADLQALDQQYVDKNLNADRARIFLTLGDAYQKAFDLQNAQRRFADAVRLFRSAGDTRGEANARYRLGIAYMRSNRVADARAELDRAVDLAIGAGYETDAEFIRQTRKLLDDVEIT